MRYQRRDSWCGPAAIQNAARAFGVRVGQDKIANHAGTTEDGSDEHDMIRACLALGFGVDIRSWSKKREAGQWLQSNVTLGIPTILCVDNFGHWVTVAGANGDYLFLIDSVETPLNVSENGIHPLKIETILRRWRAARRIAGRDHFYGIAVMRGSK